MVRRLQESLNLPLKPLLRRRHWLVNQAPRDFSLQVKNLRHRRQPRAEELRLKEMRFVGEGRKLLNRSKEVQVRRKEWLTLLSLDAKMRSMRKVSKP
jgi:hypothetical protein